MWNARPRPFRSDGNALAVTLLLALPSQRTMPEAVAQVLYTVTQWAARQREISGVCVLDTDPQLRAHDAERVGPITFLRRAAQH